MQTSKTPSRRNTRLPAQLQTLATLADLLQRLETQRRAPPGQPSPQTGAASAAQYRLVAQQVSRLLADVEPGEQLHALLSAYPAASDLYENLRYDIAGLCRAPLEQALRAEVATQVLLARARTGKGPGDGATEGPGEGPRNGPRDGSTDRPADASDSAPGAAD